MSWSENEPVKVTVKPSYAGQRLSGQESKNDGAYKKSRALDKQLYLMAIHNRWKIERYLHFVIVKEPVYLNKKIDRYNSICINNVTAEILEKWEAE